MSKELIYTSAPRGLLPGSNGFCTVAMTEGLPNSWRERLESLSAYHRPFPPDDPRNPVVFSHLRVNGRHVVSRVSEAGKEHTGRTNHLAHHVVLDDDELPAGGPAWLLSQPGFLAEAWSGAARWLAPGRAVPDGDSPARACQHWHRLAGDAGWGGVLAEAFLEYPDRPAVLLYEAGQKVLPLFAEAIALLPPERRWDVTFSTCFSGVLPGLVCSWRGVLRGTDEARELRRRPDTLVIDLADAGVAQGGPLVEMARTGRGPAAGARKKVLAARDSRPLSAPVTAYPSWAEPDGAGADDPAEVMPPPPPMPPVPPRYRASESSGLGIKLLVVALLTLLALAGGGAVVWALKVPALDKDKAELKEQLATAEKEREDERRGRLNAEGKRDQAEKDLRKAENDRDDLKRQVEEQSPKVEAYDALVKKFPGAIRAYESWKKRADQHPQKPGKDDKGTIRPSKGAEMKKDVPKEGRGWWGLLWGAASPRRADREDE
jgi:hypothetical protein